MIISIDRLKVFAYHGVFAEEKRDGQTFYLDARIEVADADADDLTRTVDYSAVATLMSSFSRETEFDLIESLATGLCDVILSKFSAVRALTVCVHKPQAPIAAEFADVSVTVYKKYTDAYLSIGANLGDREKTMRNAVDVLKQTNGVRVLAVSDFIETKPYGVVDQADFLNGCIKIETTLSPQQLLRLCQKIETDAGRVKTRRWGERVLDLDIVLYGDLIYSSAELTIPHVDMHNRAFVLDPLCKIEPGAVHPVLRKTVKMLKEELHENGCRLV